MIVERLGQLSMSKAIIGSIILALLYYVSAYDSGGQAEVAIHTC